MLNIPREKRGAVAAGASVGPYWFARDQSGNFVAHGCPLTGAEQYGQFLPCPHGHYDLWEQWRVGCPDARLNRIVRDFEYEEWPRGRVVYDCVLAQFLGYSDAQIFRPEFQNCVLMRFGIEPQSAAFLLDEHYVSTEKLAE